MHTRSKENMKEIGTTVIYEGIIRTRWRSVLGEATIYSTRYPLKEWKICFYVNICYAWISQRASECAVARLVLSTSI